MFHKMKKIFPFAKESFSHVFYYIHKFMFFFFAFFHIICLWLSSYYTHRERCKYKIGPKQSFIVLSIEAIKIFFFLFIFFSFRWFFSLFTFWHQYTSWNNKNNNNGNQLDLIRIIVVYRCCTNLSKSWTSPKSFFSSFFPSFSSFQNWCYERYNTRINVLLSQITLYVFRHSFCYKYCT